MLVHLLAQILWKGELWKKNGEVTRDTRQGCMISGPFSMRDFFFFFPTPASQFPLVSDEILIKSWEKSILLLLGVHLEWPLLPFSSCFSPNLCFFPLREKKGNTLQIVHPSTVKN